MRGLFGALMRPTEAKMTSPELDALLRGGGQSGAGPTVNWQTALQATTVLACARVIAEGIAQVPWKVYRAGAEMEVAGDHPLHQLLSSRPNDWQTSFEFRETLALHLALTGNAFAQVIRVGRERRVRAIEPIEPGRMRVHREPNGRLRYFFRDELGREDEVDRAQIWHVKGPSWNSYVGLDATRLAREAIGLSLATESAHAEMHRNGARISGVYSVKGTLNGEQFEKIARWVDRHQQGGDRAGKPLIIDNAAEWEAAQMTGADAQHLETRKHQVEEICRAMRVMPIMVGAGDKTSTYASVEQMLLAHVVHTLLPWYARFEQSANAVLLSDEDRSDGLYTKFNPNALMRGAAKDRAEFYAKALGAGGTPAWMTQDEVRALEEMAPRGGSAGELSTGAMNKGGATAPADPDNEGA